MAAKRGYVYVAEDKMRHSYYKIGKTTNLDQRERQLQGGALHERIKIVEFVQVDDMDAVEHAFHKILDRHREELGNKRSEWFNITLDEVRPMLKCLGSLGSALLPQQSVAPRLDGLTAGRTPGEWHKDGWMMHCEGATQATIAQKFGVTQGAVVAMKRKMRTAGRGHEERNRAKQGKRKKRSEGATPVSSYRQPIIDVLKRLGGSARVKDVLRGVEEEMHLGQADLKKLSNGQVTWQNRAQWARQELKDEGVLRSDSEWGWWELV